MKRVIVVPADLAGAALDELKAWLAISTPADDAALVALLRAALDTCEAFTGTMPLEAECEETLPADTGWHMLAARPVQSITQVDTLADDGTRAPLAVGDYAVDLDADGTGRVQLLRRPATGRVTVRFTAGMASDWSGLPDGMRHGTLRLAAHHYRHRNEGSEAGTPPSAVVALWQPWRRMRLV